MKKIIERSGLIDYLKAIAIVLVITNHSLNEIAKESWVYFFIIRMAVPIFVLISGFNFTSSIEKMESILDWFKGKRILKKRRAYLLPMAVVFSLWCCLEIFHGRFDLLNFIKAGVLQSYGWGAYYFWIVVQLYLFFPFVYFILQKYNRGGYCIILILNLMYEVILYYFPISISWYRIIGLRYLMLLACGCWLHDRIISREKTKISVYLVLISSFVLGCCYIAFFRYNWENTEIFRYTTWGNTNIFVCLYIIPIFFIVLKIFWGKTISISWLNKLLSTIGQSSYYILCTQMIMFWYIDRIWNHFSTPLDVRILCNIFLGAFSGVCVKLIVDKGRLARQENNNEPIKEK